MGNRRSYGHRIYHNIISIGDRWISRYDDAEGATPTTARAEAMMSDRLTRHNIILYAGDMERLKQIHTGKLTPTAVIRELVRAHITRVEAKLTEAKDVERQAS